MQKHTSYFGAKHKHPVSGFTLTEIAIVLGIVGLILGGIWVAAGHVYREMQIKTLERQIAVTLSNVKTHYANGGTPYPWGVDWSSTGHGVDIASGVIPSDWVGNLGGSGWFRSTEGYIVGDNYYTADLCDSSMSSSGHIFMISLASFYTRMPDEICTRLMLDFSKYDGMLEIDGINDAFGACPDFGSPSGPLPMTSSQAVNACNSSGTGSGIDFIISVN